PTSCPASQSDAPAAEKLLARLRREHVIFRRRDTQGLEHRGPAAPEALPELIASPVEHWGAQEHRAAPLLRAIGSVDAGSAGTRLIARREACAKDKGIPCNGAMLALMVLKGRAKSVLPRLEKLIESGALDDRSRTIGWLAGCEIQGRWPVED